MKLGPKALALAGSALDPNQEGGPCLALGRVLLHEAFLAAARDICEDATLDSLDTACERLKHLKHLDTPGVRVLREPAFSEAVAALQPTGTLDRVALQRAELTVARLVEAASGTQQLIQAMHRTRWVFAALTLLVAIFVIFSVEVLRKPWRSFTWSASSAFPGFPKSGSLAALPTHNLIFHTKQEREPWVVIDLLKTRTIDSVLVKNRLDCCQARALPLVVEAAGEDRSFMSVGVRNEPFTIWQVEFAPRQARYVRLRAVGETMLHLREIQIR